MSAPTVSRARAACRQRGAAAVELALLLSATTILMLPALALCVFTFYQFSVIKTASDDAAAYMGSIPRAAFMTTAQRVSAKTLASQIVANAIIGAAITENTTVEAALVWCPGASLSCNATVPPYIGVEVNVELDVMGFDVLYSILPDNTTNKLSYTSKTVSPYVN